METLSIKLNTLKNNIVNKFNKKNKEEYIYSSPTNDFVDINTMNDSVESFPVPQVEPKNFVLPNHFNDMSNEQMDDDNNTSFFDFETSNFENDKPKETVKMKKNWPKFFIILLIIIFFVGSCFVIRKLYINFIKPKDIDL